MLEYFKLALIKASDDRSDFLREFKRAMDGLESEQQRSQLKIWYKGLPRER